MVVKQIETYNVGHDDRVQEVLSVLGNDLSESVRVKQTNETNRSGEIVVCPKSMNKGYKGIFKQLGYKSLRPFDGMEEIDFYKDRVAVEVQFGKYCFVVYDLFAKFKTCYNMGILDVGIEVIPTRNLQKNMNAGSASFDCEVKRLNRIGIDFPLVLVGVDTNEKLIPYEQGGTLPI